MCKALVSARGFGVCVCVCRGGGGCSFQCTAHKAQVCTFLYTYFNWAKQTDVNQTEQISML